MNKTKNAIFEAAIKIFSNRGYTGATMDEIAISAGVAKGTLYYHFKSKEEIFKYIVSEGMNIIREQIDTVTKVEEGPVEKLRAICKVQLGMVYNNRDFFKVVMSQLWGQELRQSELRAAIRDYINHIENYLKEAIKVGYIKEAETSFMAYTFFGTMCSAAVFELINGENSDVDEVIEKVMSYILHGLSV
ncbi:TetR/AcrR family transcriptional regulator [Clostridium akagii]|uniref:TetR/AcrR family transcriptional regulator n=1 Tax=Clostridium akagii TaxID=91623 RepID=UPI00047B7264|nr:TetR/AcrR family transcriptional regulator [Clostridium akagii]